MKKLVALVMALVMMLSVSALAETAEIETTTWEEMSAMLEVIQPGITEQGEFYVLEDLQLKIWLPNGLVQKESEGSLYYFADDEYHGVSVFVENAPEGVDVSDPDTLVALIKETIIPDELESAVVNGIFCVNYTLGDDDYKQACLTYALNETQVVHFVIEPLDTNELSMESIAVALIAASIMPAE